MFGLPPDIWVPIKLTLELATITTLSLLVVATPLAWWLARSKAWFKEAVAAIVHRSLVPVHPGCLGGASTSRRRPEEAGFRQLPNDAFPSPSP